MKIIVKSGNLGGEKITYFPCLNGGVMGVPGSNVTYTLDSDGNLVISGSGKMFDFSFIHRSMLAHDNSIKTVLIEDGISNIGNYVFSNCFNLTKVIMPDSVKSIGECAFAQCVHLKEILVSRYAKISEDAFENCPSLEPEKKEIHSDSREDISYCHIYDFEQIMQLINCASRSGIKKMKMLSSLYNIYIDIDRSTSIDVDVIDRCTGEVVYRGSDYRGLILKTAIEEYYR